MLETLQARQAQVLAEDGRWFNMHILPYRLEASRTRYADLYDFAPVGYFTFSGRGLILEGNLTGATQLGIERSRLVNKTFRSFVFQPDRQIFDGIGFEQKYLDRIFTMFQRLHGRGVYDGMGMGLAICRKVAERHGGAITATSTPGNGSTFVITLPVTQRRGEDS